MIDFTGLKQEWFDINSTARGNDTWWREELEDYGLKFNGVGTYRLLDGGRIVLIKDGKESPPKDWAEQKAHISMKKYAYGSMFYGKYCTPKDASDTVDGESFLYD